MSWRSTSLSLCSLSFLRPRLGFHPSVHHLSPVLPVDPVTYRLFVNLSQFPPLLFTPNAVLVVRPLHLFLDYSSSQSPNFSPGLQYCPSAILQTVARVISPSLKVKMTLPQLVITSHWVLHLYQNGGSASFSWLKACSMTWSLLTSSFFTSHYYHYVECQPH